MTDSTERLINLAMYLASKQGSVTAEQIREMVAGYSPDGDDAAFKRMLERDKEFLRGCGFALECDDEGNYRIDRPSTYAAQVDVDGSEAAALRAAGLALSADPSFPFAGDLRLALSKLAAHMQSSPVESVSVLADEDAQLQGEVVARLSWAAHHRKTASFGYTRSDGETRKRSVEPYGLFLYAGRWYLVANDPASDDIRTFAVARIEHLELNEAKPKSPDFERPADFRVESFIRLPFQYGPKPFEATLRFDAQHAWRADKIAARAGELQQEADGSVTWQVQAGSADALARFVIENGPGLRLLAPDDAVSLLENGLRKAGALHA